MVQRRTVEKGEEGNASLGWGVAEPWLNENLNSMKLCLRFQKYYFDSMKRIIFNIIITTLTYCDVDFIRLFIFKYLHLDSMKNWFDETPWFLISWFVDPFLTCWVENLSLTPRISLLLSGNGIRLKFFSKIVTLYHSFAFSVFVCYSLSLTPHPHHQMRLFKIFGISK